MLGSLVVIALVKLENLKAIHNPIGLNPKEGMVVIALVKLENLKAIHNSNIKMLISSMLLLH